MNLETYLEAHGITRAQVYRTLEAAVGIEPGDVVFLSGSLLAGFGTFHSDIDAFIVTSRQLPRPPTLGNVFMLPLQDTQIDLEWWTPVTVESLFGRVEEASRHTGRRDPRPAMLFTRGELEFLYRLGIGRPLNGEAQFAALVSRLRPELVARLLFDRARVVAAAVHSDIAGFLQEGDDVSAFLSARQLVDVVAEAFLASRGEINPGPKWRYRALLATGARPESLKLPSRFGGPRTVDTFLRFWSGSLLDHGHADYAREVVTLLNFVMPWCQQRLETHDVIEKLPDRTGPVGHGSFGRDPEDVADTSPDLPLGRLKAEARVAWDGTELQLRLPGPAYAIGIGSVTHMALACFDGRTTPREAADSLGALYGSPPAVVLQAVLDLRLVLRGCGYLERTIPGARSSDR
jgi:hypothetical protein